MSANIPLFLRNEYLNPISVWDATAHGHECYHLEIYSDENYVAKEKDIDDIINMNTYKCHICNIDVPKTYINEHIKSVKHDTYMKIANIALERTQLYMKSDLVQPRRKIEVTDTYFCDHCAAVVLNRDRDKHSLSNKHQNSVKNDALLQKVIKIFEEPHNDWVASNISVIDDSNDVSQSDDIDDDNDADSEEYTDNIVESSSEIKRESARVTTSKPKKEPSPIASTSKIETQSENKSNYSENMHDLRRYLENASFKKTSSFIVTPISEDTVVVASPKLEKVKIPLVNFHGYSVTGKDVVCKICLDIDSVDGKKHKFSSLHMAKIMSPIKEGHLRQINGAINHCILCNSLIFTSQIAVHIASIDHANNLQKYAASKNISKNIARLAAANSMKWNKDIMYCKICEIHITKTNDSVNRHVQSVNHIKKHELILKDNKISIVLGDNIYFCLACEVKIYPPHLLGHCKHSQHKKRIAHFGESNAT